MKTEYVALEAIKPDENNPREIFDGIDELIDQFRFTPDRPNEPFTPLIVVKDGNIYRIVDGERRYRALVKAGKVTKVLCNIADTFEEAHSVAMMLATDDKKQLTDTERARGVQTMLCLGVDFDQVDSLGKLESGAAKKIKRALASRKDHQVKPVQISLDDLIEIADIDNPHRMAELMELAEDQKSNEWNSPFRRHLQLYKKEAKAFKDYQQFKALLEPYGFFLLNKQPEENPDIALYDDVFTQSEVIKTVESLNADGVSVSDVSVYIYLGGRPENADEWGFSPGTRAYFYIPTSVAENLEGWEQAEEDEEQMSMRQLYEEMGENLSKALEGYLRFYIKRYFALTKGRISARIKKEATDSINATYAQVIKDCGEDIEAIIDPWMIAVYWEDIEPGVCQLTDILCGNSISDYVQGSAKKQAVYFQEFLNDLVADGYEKTDFDISIEDKISDWLSSNQNDKDNEDTVPDAA